VDREVSSATSAVEPRAVVSVTRAEDLLPVWTSGHAPALPAPHNVATPVSPFRIQAHAFRHSKAVELINNGISTVLVPALAGSELGHDHGVRPRS
jgi:hypothetical protein